MPNYESLIFELEQNNQRLQADMMYQTTIMTKAILKTKKKDKKYEQYLWDEMEKLSKSIIYNDYQIRYFRHLQEV